MKAKTIRMIPVDIVPGLHIHQGHHRTNERLEGNLGGNRHRLLNLNRPGAVRLSPARHITVEEWEKS